MHYGQHKIAHLLLAHGSDVNLPNNAQRTPFYFACQHLTIKSMNREEITTIDKQFIVQLRAQYGADWHVPDRDFGASPGDFFLFECPELQGQLPHDQPG
jgi:hypothetical protein